MRAVSGFVCLLALALAAGPALSASRASAALQPAGPRITNRTAKPDEIGYRPAGNSAARFNPPSLTFRQWDGYEPKLEREFPNQWHLEAGTRERRRKIQMLTIIVPYHAGQAGDWKARRLEGSGAVGVRLERNGKDLVVAFRKAHQPGTARLADMTFDKPVALFLRGK